MTSPEVPVVRVDSPAGVLAVIPYLLGYVPESSVVVAGTSRRDGGRMGLLVRYDLGDSPDPVITPLMAQHAMAALAGAQLRSALVVGYGLTHLVTPVADEMRRAARRAKVEIADVLRVDGGRYWSYICANPACCPPEGHVADNAHPAAAALAAAGFRVYPNRAALAAVIAPVTGAKARAMAEATRQAVRRAELLIADGGPYAIEQPGRAAVAAALAASYQDRVLSDEVYAWLSVVLTRLPVRDDAWARMDPVRRRAHQRLWTEVTRRALPGLVAAPASLLAFTCWQSGEGALARIALDRALEDDPSYSMAELLRDAIDMLAPPSMATPPMTPEQVAASYADRAARHPQPAEPSEPVASGESGQEDTSPEEPGPESPVTG